MKKIKKNPNFKQELNSLIDKKVLVRVNLSSHPSQCGVYGTLKKTEIASGPFKGKELYEVDFVKNNDKKVNPDFCTILFDYSQVEQIIRNPLSTTIDVKFLNIELNDLITRYNEDDLNLDINKFINKKVFIMINSNYREFKEKVLFMGELKFNRNNNSFNIYQSNKSNTNDQAYLKFFDFNIIIIFGNQININI